MTDFVDMLFYALVGSVAVGGTVTLLASYGVV